MNNKKEKEKQKKKIKKHLKQGKRTIEKFESEVQSQRKELKIQSKAADIVLSQASKQLKECLSKNDLQGAKVAEEFLHTYKQLKDVEKEKFEKLVNNKSKVEKRKITLLTDI